jgi:hypothetical protein
VPKPEHSDGVPLLYQRQWAEAAWCSACAGALDTRAERYHLPNGEDVGPRPLWAVLGQGMAEAKSISLPHPFPLISPVHVERPVCGERQMGDKRCRGSSVVEGGVPSRDFCDGSVGVCWRPSVSAAQVAVEVACEAYFVLVLVTPRDSGCRLGEAVPVAKRFAAFRPMRLVGRPRPMPGLHCVLRRSPHTDETEIEIGSYQPTTLFQPAATRRRPSSSRRSATCHDTPTTHPSPPGLATASVSLTRCCCMAANRRLCCYRLGFCVNVA